LEEIMKNSSIIGLAANFSLTFGLEILLNAKPQHCKKNIKLPGCLNVLSSLKWKK